MGPRPPTCQNSHSSTATAGASSCGIELAGLAPEILQDGAGFEDRDRPSARAVGIDDRRHAVVGGDFEESGLELLALADIHRLQDVGELHLLQRDADLLAVGGRPVIKLDGLGGFSRALAFLGLFALVACLAGAIGLFRHQRVRRSAGSRLLGSSLPAVAHAATFDRSRLTPKTGLAAAPFRETAAFALFIGYFLEMSGVTVSVKLT